MTAFILHCPSFDQDRISEAYAFGKPDAASHVRICSVSAVTHHAYTHTRISAHTHSNSSWTFIGMCAWTHSSSSCTLHARIARTRICACACTRIRIPAYTHICVVRTCRICAYAQTHIRMCAYRISRTHAYAHMRMRI